MLAAWALAQLKRWTISRQLLKPLVPLLLLVRPPASQLKKKVDAAVIEINQVFQSANTSLAFYVDKSSQRFVVEVKDTNTGESIVKFPGEAALKIAETIESLKGVLFDKTL